ncbi:MAG: hypothetical protein RIB84_23550 [Sneathiellaceae bacterium]
MVVAKTRKQGCGRISVLVEQGQLALDLQHALDHEHHVRAAGIVLVEHDGGRRLQRPGEDSFAELGHLLAFAQHDRVLADQVDAADMAVQVHPDAGPVEARRHLLDMGGLAGAVIALDHHPPVVGEAGEDRQGRLTVEQVGRIGIRHMIARLAERRHHHVGVDAERVAHVDLAVRQVGVLGGWVIDRCLGIHALDLGHYRRGTADASMRRQVIPTCRIGGSASGATARTPVPVPAGGAVRTCS